jgi:hypothetical protein
MRLLSAVFALLTVCLAGCGAFKTGYAPFEKVTSVWIEPADPAPGDVVQVRVTWDSNLVYLAMVGAGPKVRFRVDAGSLIMEHNPQYGNTRISDREALLESKTVQWQLPADRDEATVWATMMSGGKSLTVKFD